MIAPETRYDERTSQYETNPIFLISYILNADHSVDGLEYSTPLSGDDILDDASEVELLYTPFLKLFESSSGPRRRSGAGGCCPWSANFLRMFITVGRNFVDKERSPGSCMKLRGKKKS